jgi:hypothetical protein
MTTHAEDKRDFTTRDRWLTLALVAGPWSALTDQMIAYSLHATACANDSKLLLHAATATFLLLALGAAAGAWRTYRAIDASSPALREQRARWVSLAAVVLSLFGALVIVAMEIPNVILRSCD